MEITKEIHMLIYHLYHVELCHANDSCSCRLDGGNMVEQHGRSTFNQEEITMLSMLIYHVPLPFIQHLVDRPARHLPTL